jgi:rod shape-determining protein MreD
MRVVFYYFLGLIVLYAQVLLAPGFAFASLLPSFLLGFTIYTATRLSLNSAAVLAFVLGMALDLLYPLTLGLQSFTLLMVTVTVNRLHPHLNKEKPVNVLFGILAINLIYLFLFSVYHMLAYPAGPELWMRLPLSLLLNFAISSVGILILDLINRLRLVIYE